MQLDLLKKELKRDEGVELKPYKDSVGILSLGIGRNIEEVGISKEEAEFMLDNDIKRCESDLDRALPWWRKLTDARQRAILNMVFNLGLPRLLGFVKFIGALQRGQYNVASDEMLNSLWARQVGDRAKRLANMMRNG